MNTPANILRQSLPIVSKAASGRETAICFWLFVVMIFYGPAISAIGQLRYVEIVIVAIALPRFKAAWRSCLRSERKIILLFGLTAAAQLLSDFYNASNPASTLKRTTTYLIMMALIVSLRWITGDRKRRLQWILIGYSLSYVMIMFIGGAEGLVGEIYAAEPWRLGLGFAITLMACVVASMNPKLRFFGPALLVVLAVVDTFENARAMALISLISALLSFVGMINGTELPKMPSTGKKLWMTMVVIVASVSIYFIAIIATENGLMPTEELQQKMESQIKSSYGLLATGRPDTAAAIYAISKNPIMGYGSSGYDYDVYVFYSFVSASQYAGDSNYEGILEQQLDKEWELSIPSHSHIFSAWVDAGILAPISWLAVFSLSFSVLLQGMRFKSEWSSLFCFIAVNNFWDLPFSPGPTRMDMALRIVILFFAIRIMNPNSNAQSTYRRFKGKISPRLKLS